MPDNPTPADYALDVEEALAVADRIGDLDQPLPDRDLCQRAALGLATAVRGLRDRNTRLGVLRVEAEGKHERLVATAAAVSLAWADPSGVEDRARTAFDHDASPHSHHLAVALDRLTEALDPA